MSGQENVGADVVVKYGVPETYSGEPSLPPPWRLRMRTAASFVTIPIQARGEG